MKHKITHINSIAMYNKTTNDKNFEYITDSTCPLFNFCNCKTAVCRVQLPDESCYWYRYFENLIKIRG